MKINIQTIENKFFKSVQYVGFALASLAAIVFLFFALSALNGFFSSANEKIATSEHTLKGYQSYLKEIEISKDLETTDKTVDTKSDKKSSESKKSKPTKNEKMIEEIAENFKIYAEKTEQNVATAADFERFIYQRLGQLDDNLVDSYIKQLHKASKSFKKLKIKDDQEPVIWNDYINWQHELFVAGLQEEFERVENEQAQAIEDNINAATKLPLLLGTLAIFLFFTLILVLLRIESNTRRNAE